MPTIIIKPRTTEETKLLTSLLKKMNIEAELFEEPVPNYETRKAMKDVEERKGSKANSSNDLFNNLDI